MTGEKVSRRKWVKYAGAGVVVAAIAGAGYYATQPKPVTITPTATPTTPTATPTPTPKPMEMTYYSWAYAPEIHQEHLDWFMQAYPNIKVSYVNLPAAQYSALMLPKFVAGEAIDVCTVNADDALPAWVAAGYILPLTKDEFPEVYNEYRPAMDTFVWETFTYKDVCYGLPYYSDYLGLMYNKEYLDKAGIDQPPTTWDELVDQCLKIKQKGILEYPLQLIMKAEWGLNFLWHALIYSRERRAGLLFDMDMNPVFNTSGSRFEEVLQWLRDCIVKWKIMSTKAFETGEGDGFKAFAAGEMAFHLAPNYRLQQANDPSLSKIAGKARGAMFPGGKKGEHGTCGWARCYSITKLGKAEREAQRKLLIFLGGKHEGKYKVAADWMIKKGLGQPYGELYGYQEIRDALKKYYLDPDLIKEQRKLILPMEGFKHRKTGEVIPWFMEWLIYNHPLIQKAASGDLKPIDALNDMANKWNELKKKYVK
ncbi:extracellular solute-binding protein [Candidatus Bathyarchaeota archaeon]|nr:extracellular solute-binding protein [Candidatus Bathyarchaeota archaeon]